MTYTRLTKTIAAFALVTLAAAPAAFAQAPTTAPAPQHQSIFHKLFGKKPAPSTMQSGTPSHTPYGSHVPYGSHPGMMSHGYGTGRMTRSPYGSSMTSHAGNIIGNKNSHVYHMPGDTGSLPAVQNRVYFTTEAQATAAGFHRAGSGHSSMKSHGMHSMAPMHH